MRVCARAPACVDRVCRRLSVLPLVHLLIRRGTWPWPAAEPQPRCRAACSVASYDMQAYIAYFQANGSCDTALWATYMTDVRGTKLQPLLIRV